MIRPFIVSALLIILTETSFPQNNDTLVLYHPDMDAVEQIDQAILLAQSENKHVLIQVGGNWCPWCIRLHKFIKQHQTLDSLIRADYVLLHVNYSMENKNPEAMKRLEFPQRFSFPVFVILDAEGKRLHTQNTAYLEEKESYNEEKIKEFLLNWNYSAINPETY